jgi:hypothetical protein
MECHGNGRPNGISRVMAAWKNFHGGAGIALSRVWLQVMP